jgi:SAM-dependent methyltransferase
LYKLGTWNLKSQELNMRRSILLALIVATLFLPAAIYAQQNDYEPSVGQEGKDVIWVPTPDELVQAMLDLAKVTPQDTLMDLGSGDGRIVIAAAKRGARATGIEYNPDMVELSKRNAEKAGVSGKATFVNADLFTTDLSHATVITMYLLPSLNLKLRPTILNLKPGTRVVSHAFTMGEWHCDKSIVKEGRTAYLWIVPAKAGGVWTWRSGDGTAELKLSQTFQMIEGTLKLHAQETAVKNAKLDGSHISFDCGDEEYDGQVKGTTIEGLIRSKGQEQKWSATQN